MNQFLAEKLKNLGFSCSIFIELLPKHSDFVHSNDCISNKSYQNLSTYIQFFFKKTFEANKKYIFYSEKL